MIKSIILLALVSVQFIDASISPGKCVNIPVIKEFNAAAYLGKWYEIERFNYIFEDFLNCVAATYGSINSTHISVHNQGYNTYEFLV